MFWKGNSMNSMKKIFNRHLLVILTILMSILLVGCGDGVSNSSNTKELIEKLGTFTEEKVEEGRYSFNYGEEWSIIYNEHTELITFKDQGIVDSFTQMLGEGCFTGKSISEGGFCYVPEENKFRIYVDVDFADGHLTIVSYYPEDNTFTFFIDLEEYYVSDENEEILNSYGVAEVMNERLNECEKVMEENGLSVDAITQMSYQDILETVK